MIGIVIQPQGMAPAGINFVPAQPQELGTLGKSKGWDNIPADKSINTELSRQELIPLKPRSPESSAQPLQTRSILPSLDRNLILFLNPAFG